MGSSQIRIIGLVARSSSLVVGHVLGLVSGLVALTGCYSPPHPECGFVCGANGACPADYTCNSRDNVCHLNGSPSTPCAVDAAIADAPVSIDADNSVFVTGTSPFDGEINVSRTADITTTFNRHVGSINGATFVVSDGVTTYGGTLSYDSGSETAHFAPNPALPSNHLIGVQLTSGIVTPGGLPLSPTSFSFTTIDDEAPTLASSIPIDTATAVPVASTISVTFSELVAGVSTTSFTLDSGAIAGMISTSDSITYVFTPTSNLPAATLITVSLTGAIHDFAPTPNTLAPVQFTFTTQ